MQPVYLTCQWAFRLKAKQRSIPDAIKRAGSRWKRANFVKQYLRQGEIIGAVKR
jgi:hypothetical protein